MVCFFFSLFPINQFHSNSLSTTIQTAPTHILTILTSSPIWHVICIFYNTTGFLLLIPSSWTLSPTGKLLVSRPIKFEYILLVLNNTLSNRVGCKINILYENLISWVFLFQKKKIKQNSNILSSHGQHTRLNPYRHFWLPRSLKVCNILYL
jgi:hypothetical protein